MAKARRAGGVSKSAAIRNYLEQHGNAPPKEVVDALGKEGVTVSTGLVSNVKFHMGSGKGTKKKVAKRRAGRGGVNKSEEIRSYLKENPNATPREIQEGLAKRGIKVSPGLIGVVKYSKPVAGGGRRGGRRGVRRAAGRPSGSASSLSAQDLVDAKQLIDQMGGADRVRQALDLLDQLS